MQPEIFIPCNQLKPFVRRFIIQECPDEALYKVLPDTSIVIGFQYKGSISAVSNSTEHKLSPYGITGLPRSARFFKNERDTGTVLVFFNETGAARFFQEPLHEFYSKSVSLDNLVPYSRLSELQQQLQEAQTSRARIELIENFLLSRLSFGEQDNLIFEAVRQIRQNNGSIRMDALSKRLYISKSPFEKRFRRIVGTSPKKFASLVRFRSLVEQYQKNMSLTELSYEAGFYDQSHFIKQFRALTGDSPENFFSALR